MMFALASCQTREAEPLPTIAEWTEPVAVSRPAPTLATSEPDPDGVKLIGVTMADGISSIMVNFSAPSAAVAQWWQGSVYVVDEKTGATYSEIPVMPVVGPLFGKPHEEGQAGYCMLINYDRGVQSGSIVTVVLGSYKREHVKIP